jgi:hypothetical protein
MRILFFFISLSLLISCAPDKELKGVWKVQDVWTEKEDRFHMAEFIRANMKSLHFAYGDSNTSIIVEKDTVNSFLYHVTKDTLIMHTQGLDIKYILQFPADDTLIMKDKEGIVMKLSRLEKD